MNEKTVTAPFHSIGEDDFIAIKGTMYKVTSVTSTSFTIRPMTFWEVLFWRVVAWFRGVWWRMDCWWFLFRGEVEHLFSRCRK